MKNLRSWHQADQAEWKRDRQAGASHQAAGRRIPGRSDYGLALCSGEYKRSTILLKKAGLVHDLLERI
jgi:hypothetical protein